MVTLAAKGQVFANYTTAWGTRTSAIACKTVSVVVWGGTAVTSAVSMSTRARPRSGTVVGSASFTAGTQRLTVPLVLSKKLAGPDGFWRLAHPGALL